MELIERYLQAVKFALPRAQQDDIVKELRDSILSQVEDKEASLGRALTTDEQVDLLKKLGRPSDLAARYRKQQYLIGATMFPIYWKVLKLSLILAFVVHVGVTIALAAAGKHFSECLAVLFHYPSAALAVFAWVTLVFVALDFFGAKLSIKDCWDPRTLPPLVKEKPPKSRFELITQLVVQTIFGAWWLAGLHYQYLIFGPGAAFFRFGPVFQAIYPLFVGMVLVDISFTVAAIFHPQWSNVRRISRVVMSGIGLLVLYFLIKTPELLVAADPASAQMQDLSKTVNNAIHLALMVAVVVSIINLVVGGARLLGRWLARTHEPAACL